MIMMMVVVLAIIIIIITISCHRFSFFPGASPLEPVVNPTYYYYHHHHYFLSQVFFLHWCFSS
jgi:hypothetical protein